MNLNDEFTKWKNGNRDYTTGQIAILEAYEIALTDVSTENIMAMTEHLEEAFNECK